MNRWRKTFAWLPVFCCDTSQSVWLRPVWRRDVNMAAPMCEPYTVSYYRATQP